MFLEPVNTILTTLRELTDVRTPARAPKFWIMYSKPEEDAVFPFISLKHISTNTISAGIGQSDLVSFKQKTDVFTTISTQTDFNLSQPGLLQVHSVTLNPDPDPPQTWPDYYTYDKDTSIVKFRTGVAPGTVVTITYSYDIQNAEVKARYVTHIYNVIIYAKRNTANVNDEIFTISGEKYANGKLIDYLAELVFLKLIQRYREMRTTGWKIHPQNPSEEIYDPDTRLFAKVISVVAESTIGVEVVEPNITDVEETISVVSDGD